MALGPARSWLPVQEIGGALDLLLGCFTVEGLALLPATPRILPWLTPEG